MTPTTLDREAEALLDSLRARGVPEADIDKLRETARRWAEIDLARRGGLSTSPAKQEAARVNGRRGGRPRQRAS